MKIITSSSSVLNFTISQDGMQKSNIEDTSVKVYLNENIQSYAKNGKNFKTNLEGVSVKFVDRKIFGRGFLCQEKIIVV